MTLVEQLIISIIFLMTTFMYHNLFFSPKGKKSMTGSYRLIDLKVRCESTYLIFKNKNQ